MNTYWISLPCDLLSSLASFQCSLLHHLHLSSDLGLSKYVNQHSHLNLSRNVRLSVLYDLDFNTKYPFKFQQNHRWMTCCPPQLPKNAPSFFPLLYMAWSCWITTLHSWFTWLLFREGENRHQFQSNFEANQPPIPLSPFQGQGSFVAQTTQRPYTKLTLYCP